MEPEYVRLFLFLESVRAVWSERACLTEQGCAYLGVKFRFPAHDPWEILPSTVATQEIAALKERILRTLDEGTAA